jgi:hypothetical protein
VHQDFAQLVTSVSFANRMLVVRGGFGLVSLAVVAAQLKPIYRANGEDLWEADVTESVEIVSGLQK